MKISRENDQKEAQMVFDIEAQAILNLKNRLSTFSDAINLLHSCKGKVIVSGIGKSGVIGRKLSSTFNSTGTPALFLHPAESSHGDLGVISQNDIVLAISYSGANTEMNDLLNYVARKNIPLIAITGQIDSELARTAHVVLNVAIEKEACPMGLAPTASSTATLAMGDALAIVLLKRKGFNEEDFAEFHPGGKLGRRLLTRVQDVMKTSSEIPIVKRNFNLRQVIVEMTHKEIRGVAVVLEENGDLAGVIVDGDIRRWLERHSNPLEVMAETIMTPHPKTIDASELAEKALFMMEQFSILSLIVVDRSSEYPSKPVGVIHLHDLLKAKIR